MIEVQNITKQFGPIRAVDGVSFTVRKGEILGFLGPNGAGKTTTMRVLTGYMPPTSGVCRIAGIDVFDDPIGVKRKIGYLPETAPLYPELTVAEYLGFVARVREIPRREAGLAIARIMERCGLAHVGRRLIGKLSKGYRQRVGLAQALVHDPEVIVLDEPTIGLDPAQIREVRQFIRDLGEAHTVILSTHILPEAGQVCDRILIIDRGRIVAEDTPEKLLAPPTEDVVCECLVRGEETVVRAAVGSFAEADGFAMTPSSGGMWRCDIPAKTGDERPEILRRLLGAGLDVHEFSTRKQTLEDVFLRLTLRDEVEQAQRARGEDGGPPPSDGLLSQGETSHAGPQAGGSLRAGEELE